jgi:hypothetical protein
MVDVGIRVEGLAPSLTIANEMVSEGVRVFAEASVVWSSPLVWGPGHSVSHPGIVE